MTMTADKTAAAPIESQPNAEKAAPPATDKVGGVRPVLAHDKRRALGRGLESLLPGPRPPAAKPPEPGTASGAAGGPEGGASASAGVSSGAGVAPGAWPGTEVGARPGAGSQGQGPTDAAGAVSAVLPELHGQAARKAADGHEVIDLALDLIDHNPYQTRVFSSDDEDALGELAESIRVNGVIQPITVRRGQNGRYILVAGERRVRASRSAKKSTVPAIVRTVSEQQAAEMTVIENLQRADLNCMEQARAYILLSQDFGLTQEQIGERVGVSRESVSNYMRLAKLPELVQRYLLTGQLEFSHARALLNLKDPEVMARVAHKAATENWSVEKLEHFVLFDPSMFKAQKEPPKGGGARWVDPNVRAAQRKLEEILGVKVRIRDRKGKGKITLEYATLEDFDRVLGMLTGK
jgi:ParB family chromosome partitioning protein